MNRTESYNSYEVIPQFNVACVGNYVCLSCNAKLLSTAADLLGNIEEVAKDFAEFLDNTVQAVSGNASAIFDEDSEYCIIKFENVFQINMKQEFAKDLAYSVMDSLRSLKKEHQFSNALYSFARRMEAAAEGNIQRPMQNRHPMQNPQPVLMYPPMPMYRQNFQYSNRRKYGSY
jgi:hypothetical protein